MLSLFRLFVYADVQFYLNGGSIAAQRRRGVQRGCGAHRADAPLSGGGHGSEIIIIIIIIMLTVTHLSPLT